MKNLLLALVLSAGIVPAAFASIVVTLDSITPFGGDFDWNYTATVSPDDGLEADGNTYFTIYDLPGNIVTVEAAPDWQASSQLTGVTPAGLMPADDPTLRNVTFEFIGGSWPGSNTPVISPFRIRLETDVAEFGEYAWQDYASYPNVDPDTGALAELQNGLGTVEDGLSGNVPEPATLALLGLGLAGIGFTRHRKPN